MDLKFALLADHATLTRDGKLVIVGDFDAITAPKLPATHPQFFVVVRFQASITEGTGSHRLDSRDR